MHAQLHTRVHPPAASVNASPWPRGPTWRRQVIFVSSAFQGNQAQYGGALAVHHFVALLLQDCSLYVSVSPSERVPAR